MKRYALYVCDDKGGKELVSSYSNLVEAQEKKYEFELNRQRHVDAHDELSYHYKNLHWQIVDMGA